MKVMPLSTEWLTSPFSSPTIVAWPVTASEVSALGKVCCHTTAHVRPPSDDVCSSTGPVGAGGRQAATSPSCASMAATSARGQGRLRRSQRPLLVRARNVCSRPRTTTA